MTDLHHPAPPRGFTEAEYRQRLERAQRAMAAARLDGILLTTEPEVRYFSGFHTQFWESPTRPWFLVLPSAGEPIAVVPEIGAAGMAATWVRDIRTWASPRPADDGVSLLAAVLSGLTARHGRLGASLGVQSHLRMPWNDFMALRQGIRAEFVDCMEILVRQRMVKSEPEIDKIRHACRIAGAGFAALPEFARVGMSEREICRALRIELLRLGADHSPYLIAGSGPGGYDSIIMGPGDRGMEPGDVLIIDTGTVFDGYFCDFDRNWAFGHADAAARKAYATVFAATDAGFAAARPGATTTDLWHAMWSVLEAGGALGNEVGRLGHGLGMQLTEQPSNTADDDTVLEPGMVLTLEPGMTYAPGRQMVHEENLVITADGAEWLSPRAAPRLRVIC